MYTLNSLFSFNLIFINVKVNEFWKTEKKDEFSNHKNKIVKTFVS